jgi:hypothetical protein
MQMFGVLWCQFDTEGVLLAGIGIRTCGNAGTIGVLIVAEDEVVDVEAGIIGAENGIIGAEDGIIGTEDGIIGAEDGIIGTEDEVDDVIGGVWAGKSCKSF